MALRNLFELLFLIVTATPVITDADRISSKQKAEEVERNRCGYTLSTLWTSEVAHSSFAAAPLISDVDADGIFDIDGNGMLDLLFTMSSGELLFYDSDGALFKQHRYQSNDYIPVDVHVLATPVLADLNNDDRLEELVIPLSYFFEEDDYRAQEKLQQLGNMTLDDLEFYLLTGVNSAFPAYNLFSPTVIDIDSLGGSMEIIMGTSAGNLYILDTNGNHRDGWPVSLNTLHGQVTVADLDMDGKLNIVTIDTSGNVVCMTSNGITVWESEINGNSSAGSRLYDVNNDGVLDVIIATNFGDVYALDGKTGTTLPNWPVKTGHPILSNVLITKISTKTSTPDMVFLGANGVLHLMTLDFKCRSQLTLGETSFVQILSYDLVSQSEGLELLVSTNDGTLMCLGSGIEPEDLINEDENKKHYMQNSLSCDTNSINDFSYDLKKESIYVMPYSRYEGEVTGGKFVIEYEIIDPLSKGGSQYHVKVYFGKNLLSHVSHDHPGVKSVVVPAWEEPSQGHVIVYLTNKHMQIHQDVYNLRFNKLVLEDLQWLLLAPFVVMVIILLVIHGFPVKDLLPYTYQSKSR
ncbi:hypothetical protein KUTeg_013315 [Tegillarca granosa]|uniref:DEX1 C-terminal domain-containing protein n=1 Tax=Tegillarca granosa TaxID=220873 RepID=A0ABQ9EWU1_TEGGR|nr:hypothetical protein KUTeg_013315 [Tegillarca granosa]